MQLADQLLPLLPGDEIRKTRERLRATGPEQAARFNWDATAAATAAVYERALRA